MILTDYNVYFENNRMALKKLSQPWSISFFCEEMNLHILKLQFLSRSSHSCAVCSSAKAEEERHPDDL